MRQQIQSRLAQATKRSTVAALMACVTLVGCNAGPKQTSISYFNDPAEHLRADDAQYVTVDGKDIGTEITVERQFQTVATKRPRHQLTKFTNEADWRAFLLEHAGVDVATNQPLAYRPDFTKESMLAVFVDGNKKHFSEMEFYTSRNTLRAFAFHWGQSAQPHPPNPKLAAQRAGSPYAGQLYLAAVPKQWAGHRVEFRTANQSWGRVCSRFSYAIVERD